MNPNNNTRFKRLRHQILRLRHRTFDTVITDVIMPAKAPIYLKTKNGKDGKRYREALSAEMISHPLGDVRHTAHVGHGSDDVFGDTTFLKNVENAEASTSHQMGSKASSERSLDSMTSSSVRHRNMWKKKSRNHSAELQNENSPKRKSAIMTSSSTTEASKLQMMTSTSDPESDEIIATFDLPPSPMTSSDTNSLLEGWGVDLGPPILDDVMKIMDNVEEL